MLRPTPARRGAKHPLPASSARVLAAAPPAKHGSGAGCGEGKRKNSAKALSFRQPKAARGTPSPAAGAQPPHGPPQPPPCPCPGPAARRLSAGAAALPPGTHRQGRAGPGLAAPRRAPRSGSGGRSPPTGQTSPLALAPSALPPPGQPPAAPLRAFHPTACPRPEKPHRIPPLHLKGGGTRRAAGRGGAGEGRPRMRVAGLHGNTLRMRGSGVCVCVCVWEGWGGVGEAQRPRAAALWYCGCWG